MKPTLYLSAATLAILMASCSGSKEYDAYVDALNRQIEAIDTISTPQAFAMRIDSVAQLSQDFESAGIKLTDYQQANLDSLSNKLQESFAGAYERLVSTPVALPDSIAVEDMPTLQ